MDFQFAQRMQSLSGSAIREILKLTANPEVISFAGGNPLASSFPKEEMAAIAERLIREDGARILQYGATEGWAPLRESVAALAEKRGMQVSAEQVLPLTGSSQGIELMTKAFIDKGDVILCESPTFLGALQTFYTYQATVIGVEMDENGMRMDDLEAKIQAYHPKFIYTIPTFQNPMGVTMPTERRIKMAELAKQYGVMILEDDPYGELRYAGQPLDAIKKYGGDHVVHLMSFSKTISPGLRVGAAIGHPDVLRKMVILKQGMDVHTPLLNQAVVDAYIRMGAYEQHVQDILPPYQKQMETMLACFADFPAGVTYTKPQGGLFIWAELPAGVNATELMAEAVKRNVAYVPGVHFYAANGKNNTIRLNFSNSTPERIKQGMAALADLMKETLA